MNKELQVNCPHCKKKFLYFSSEYRPFCCERCKMVDLGHWLSETYTVPVKSDSPDKLTELDDDEENE